MPHILKSRPQRRTPAAAILGVMASAALITAWAFERRVGGLERPAATLLLEFLMVFVLVFGTLVVSGLVTGVLPLRLGRPPRR
jgi:hypothetical protein